MSLQKGEIRINNINVENILLIPKKNVEIPGISGEIYIEKETNIIRDHDNKHIGFKEKIDIENNNNFIECSNNNINFNINNSKVLELKKDNLECVIKNNINVQNIKLNNVLSNKFNIEKIKAKELNISNFSQIENNKNILSIKNKDDDKNITIDTSSADIKDCSVNNIFSDSIIPIGTILSFLIEMQNTENSIQIIKEKYLLCNGAELPIGDNKYNELYKVIGDKYNDENNGVGNFKLPNLEGKTLFGIIGNNKKKNRGKSNISHVHKYNIHKHENNENETSDYNEHKHTHDEKIHIHKIKINNIKIKDQKDDRLKFSTIDTGIDNVNQITDSDKAYNYYKFEKNYYKNSSDIIEITDKVNSGIIHTSNSGSSILNSMSISLKNSILSSSNTTISNLITINENNAQTDSKLIGEDNDNTLDELLPTGATKETDGRDTDDDVLDSQTDGNDFNWDGDHYAWGQGWRQSQLGQYEILGGPNWDEDDLGDSWDGVDTDDNQGHYDWERDGLILGGDTETDGFDEDTHNTLEQVMRMEEDDGPDEPDYNDTYHASNPGGSIYSNYNYMDDSQINDMINDINNEPENKISTNYKTYIETILDDTNFQAPDIWIKGNETNEENKANKNINFEVKINDMINSDVEEKKIRHTHKANINSGGGEIMNDTNKITDSSSNIIPPAMVVCFCIKFKY